MKLKKRVYIFVGCALGLLSQHVQAQDNVNLSLGMKLLAKNWQGDNKSSGTDFEANEGGQFALNLALQTGRFYTGVNFQGGEYSFDDNAPDQVTGSGRLAVSNVKIQRGELDLIAGYFFWEHVSLFIDFKGIVNKWNNNDHEQSFAGVGLGASGLWPIDSRWSMYGSLGFVSGARVEVNDQKVGEGRSAALEIGAAYSINTRNRLTFGVKSQTQTYEYDSGDEQEHRLNGLFVGYNHIFQF